MQEFQTGGEHSPATVDLVKTEGRLEAVRRNLLVDGQLRNTHLRNSAGKPGIAQSVAGMPQGSGTRPAVQLLRGLPRVGIRSGIPVEILTGSTLVFSAHGRNNASHSA